MSPDQLRTLRSFKQRLGMVAIEIDVLRRRLDAERQPGVSSLKRAYEYILSAEAELEYTATVNREGPHAGH